MVRICAALAWFDEAPGFLARCVSSLHGLVDEIVALDGAWELFPGAACCSAVEQRSAIQNAATGTRLRLVEPDVVFASQVAKRAELMRLASKDADWVFVIDSDEHVTHSDPGIVRGLLESAAADMVVGSVEITNVHRGESIPGYHPQGGLKRRFYRAGTTVVKVHTGYSFQGRWLYESEPCIDLGEHLRLEHDFCNRGHERNDRARAYRVNRERERVEVWV